jgi:geranylgeranyl diphosphate synthase type I
MVSAVRDLCMRGGKRLRPALVVAGLRAVSTRADLDAALDVGTALELLQAFFLIHDDWMDGDATRRGGPSVHALLTRRFRSEDIGAASAVLAGDYAAALAVETLARVDAPQDRLVSLLSCFAQMQTDAIIGQQLDLMGKGRDLEAMYKLKTGSYSVRGPLRLGALLAGGSPGQLNALDRFAIPVGVAFQLRDDLLGAFGDPKLTGKPFGSDVQNGKRTMLMQLALKRARGKDQKLLGQVFGSRTASVADLARALGVVERVGARGLVEQRIDELATAGRAALTEGGLTPGGRELLDGASRVLTERRS